MLYPLMKEIVNTPPHVVRNLSNCLVDELLLYKLLAFQSRSFEHPNEFLC